MKNQPIIQTILILSAILLTGCNTKEETNPLNIVKTANAEESENTDTTINAEASKEIIIVNDSDEAADSKTVDDASDNTNENTSNNTHNDDTNINTNNNTNNNTNDTDNDTNNNSIPLSNGTPVTLNRSWKYAEFSSINSGSATYYEGTGDKKGITIGVNAGHGTKGGSSVKTYCHPDMSPKTTGGSTGAGSVKATAVAGGMTFLDGTGEAAVTLKVATALKNELLNRGYNVLMIRDSDDVQLDNVARTVICNNAADCHIALHFDGDSLDYDKGCFFISVPDGIKGMEPVASTWQKDDALGNALITSLANNGFKINGNGSTSIDLTQTSYSSVPSVDIELGNQCTDHSNANISKMAQALADGVDLFY